MKINLIWIVERCSARVLATVEEWGSGRRRSIRHSETSNLRDNGERRRKFRRIILSLFSPEMCFQLTFNLTLNSCLIFKCHCMTIAEKWRRSSSFCGEVSFYAVKMMNYSRRLCRHSTLSCYSRQSQKRDEVWHKPNDKLCQKWGWKSTNCHLTHPICKWQKVSSTSFHSVVAVKWIIYTRKKCMSATLDLSVTVSSLTKAVEEKRKKWKRVLFQFLYLLKCLFLRFFPSLLPVDITTNMNSA